MPTEFAEDVLDLVARIPPGQVLTYGDVARLLGGGGARAVGTVLARFGGGVPWWRVVRAGGLLPRGLEERAVRHHRAEGTPLLGEEPTTTRVDLRRCRWSGGGPVGAA